MSSEAPRFHPNMASSGITFTADEHLRCDLKGSVKSHKFQCFTCKSSICTNCITGFVVLLFCTSCTQKSLATSSDLKIRFRNIFAHILVTAGHGSSNLDITAGTVSEPYSASGCLIPDPLTWMWLLMNTCFTVRKASFPKKLLLVHEMEVFLWPFFSAFVFSLQRWGVTGIIIELQGQRTTVTTILDKHFLASLSYKL